MSPQTAEPIPDLTAWEEAYRRFETPEQEVEKFLRRLRQLGAAEWPRDGRILELFCGRANGCVALERMGFERLAGGDLSTALLSDYQGPAELCTLDARRLPFPTASFDRVVIQGGLHHLPTLPEDLDEVLAEVRRVLVEDGRVMIVEPWRTPFLVFVHWVCEWSIARRMWSKLDALAVMTELEIETYEQWLGQPELVSMVLDDHFRPIHRRHSLGKLRFVGTPR